MAYSDHSPRVGRSQGVLIFWGLISAVFAALFCYYFWKNHEHESAANKWRDEVLNLQDERDTLNSQKEKLQASMSERESQLKSREDFLQDKETKLAAQESRLDATASQQSQKSAAAPAPDQAQAPMIKKFGDTVRKATKDGDSDVVTRGGRPVLRVPNTVLFAQGDTILKPEGKALLTQIAQLMSTQSDHFELRVENFTDGDSELQRAPGDAPAKPSNVQKKDPAEKPDPDAGKSRFASGWDLSVARAAAISRFFRDQTSLPFTNVLVIARGDSSPIVTAAKDDHARNHRTEITFAPLPATYHPSGTDASVDPLKPPPDPPAPAKKDKEKDKDKEKAK